MPKIRRVPPYSTTLTVLWGIQQERLESLNPGRVAIRAVVSCRVLSAPGLRRERNGEMPLDGLAGAL
jgi:hypothetical protein